MEKKSKKLYTLKHNSVLDGVETVIPFIDVNGETKEKLTLTEIDSYTTLFENSFSLMDGLNTLGYNFFNSHFFIEYQYNHQRNKTELVYSDQETLRHFAINNQGQSTVKNDTFFNLYVYRLIEMAKEDPEMMRFLRKNNYISTWLKQNIEKYNVYINTDVEAAHINITQIKNTLKDYKVIRDIEIGKKEYEKEKLFKQQLEEKKKQFIKKKQKPKKNIEGQGQLFNPDNY